MKTRGMMAAALLVVAVATIGCGERVVAPPARESAEREPAVREPKATPFFSEEHKPSFDVDDDVLDIPSFLRDR